MKLSAIIITTLLLFTLTSSVKANIENDIKASSRGGNSSVKVNVNNNVNTGSSSSYSEEETNTKVEISQTGEGSSSVNINGKEWKLEGPGEINVNESSNTTDSPSQLDESADENSPEESELISLTPSPTPSVLSVSDEKKSFAEAIIDVIFASIRSAFFRIANIF